jgi:hypothetical protein
MSEANIEFVHIDEDGVTVDGSPLTGIGRWLNNWATQFEALGIVVAEHARMNKPPFDPEYINEQLSKLRVVPMGFNGTIHFGDDFNRAPKCGASPDTLVSANWRIVNCEDCRTETKDT